MRTGRPLLAVAVLLLLLPGCAERTEGAVLCRVDDPTLVLAAQAVPSATMIPCVAQLPAGWSYSGNSIGSGRSRFWLDSDRGGIHALEVDLTRVCDVSDAVDVTSAEDEIGVRVFSEPISLRPAFQANRYLVFPGGCATYRYRFLPGAASTLALEADQALTFVPRAELVRHVRRELGVTLCGANAPPCEG